MVYVVHESDIKVRRVYSEDVTNDTREVYRKLIHRELASVPGVSDLTAGWAIYPEDRNDEGGVGLPRAERERIIGRRLEDQAKREKALFQEPPELYAAVFTAKSSGEQRRNLPEASLLAKERYVAMAKIGIESLKTKINRERIDREQMPWLRRAIVRATHWLHTLDSTALRVEGYGSDGALKIAQVVGLDTSADILTFSKLVDRAIGDARNRGHTPSEVVVERDTADQVMYERMRAINGGKDPRRGGVATRVIAWDAAGKPVKRSYETLSVRLR